MAWIEHCECQHHPHGKGGCKAEPTLLVRVTEWSEEQGQEIEVVRAVCGHCHFSNTPILARYGP